MLDIQSGTWIEITFIEGYEPKCTLSNILYGIMYREVQLDFTPEMEILYRVWAQNVVQELEKRAEGATLPSAASSA